MCTPIIFKVLFYLQLTDRKAIIPFSTWVGGGHFIYIRFCLGCLWTISMSFASEVAQLRGLKGQEASSFLEIRKQSLSAPPSPPLFWGQSHAVPFHCLTQFATPVLFQNLVLDIFGELPWKNVSNGTSLSLSYHYTTFEMPRGGINPNWCYH